jgi:hypothetical protein
LPVVLEPEPLPPPHPASTSDNVKVSPNAYSRRDVDNDMISSLHRFTTFEYF